MIGIVSLKITLGTFSPSGKCLATPTPSLGSARASFLQPQMQTQLPGTHIQLTNIARWNLHLCAANDPFMYFRQVINLKVILQPKM